MDFPDKVRNLDMMDLTIFPTAPINKHPKVTKMNKYDLDVDLEEIKKMTVLDYVRSKNIATPEKLAERKKMAREMVFVLPGNGAADAGIFVFVVD